MMKFRRSLKSDGGKHDSTKPVQISIPQKDAIAIEPPKKVIKALYDYTAPVDPPHYLSFTAGDFLHVVSRENDADWYEACNPMKGTRGLVPVKYFQEVGKTVRDSGESGRSLSATHDSGYAEGTPARSTVTSAPSGASTVTSRTSTMNGGHPEMQSFGHRSSKSMSRAGGVYGIVSFDFDAERPDELDAKAGEAIIVIAQSNPEWFVAKPITRLGGPGLIPVSFIEIRDMTTGKPVDDPVAAVAKAGIPRVEEWKKMAAEYKNTSIPLGSVSSSQQAQNLQQSMERISISNASQVNGQSHERTPSNLAFQQQQQQGLFAPVRASVPRYIFADDKFHFIVECKLSNGSHWDLSRIYEDFYELQINLIHAFPEEAGQVAGKPRLLPYMPGPVKFVTDNISEGRRANLDEYLRDLLTMPQHITSSSLVRRFFLPREGSDYEVDASATDLNEHARAAERQDRYSAVSQASYSNPAHQSQQGPAAAPVLHSHSQSQTSNSYGHQSRQASQSTNTYSSQPSEAAHYRSPSQYTTQSTTGPSAAVAAGPITRQPTAQSSTTPSLAGSGPVKVKAWFDRDTCVVIRMPARENLRFEDLYQKIVERRRLEFKGQPGDESEKLDIEYRDEKDGEYYRLEGNEDLEIAVERNEKLTLAVRAADA